MTTPLKLIASMMLIAFVGLSPGLASAVEGVVVQVQASEVIIDLGRTDGLADHAVVELFRRVEVKHPGTGKVIVDRFPIGTVTLSQVGELLSIATAFNGLERAPALGDFVVFDVSSFVPAKVDEEAPLIDPQECEETDPATGELETAFAETLGKTYDERILAWRSYLSNNPYSPYTSAVYSEIDWLQAQNEAERQPNIVETEEPSPELTARFSGPSALGVNEPFTVNVSVLQTERVAQVRLLIRHTGEPAFTTLPMSREGDFNWQLQIDQEWKQAGSVELIAEVVRMDGVAQAVAGRFSQPLVVTVTEPKLDVVDETNRTQASVAFEVVDFWLSSAAKDAYLRFEADVAYLVDFKSLHKFTIGVGVFEGTGGTVKTLEDTGDTITRSINYGSGEVELELHEYVGLGLRLSLGNGHLDDQDRGQTTVGGGAILRIGDDEGTHLNAGITAMESVGNEGWIELVLNEIERIPITAAVVATNLPVGEDIGVSLNAGIGYRFGELLSVSVTTGWNARTINHWGLSLGTAAVLTW